MGRRCCYFGALGLDPDSDLAEMAIAAVRQKRERSPQELAMAIRRLIRAMAFKAMEEDPEFLPEMAKIRENLDWWIQQVVRELRTQGYTWDSIGKATGTTRQAALMKWRPQIAPHRKNGPDCTCPNDDFHERVIATEAPTAAR